MNAPRASAVPLSKRNLLLLGSVWVGLSLNLFLAIALYQPNVLTWDQWDFFAPLFRDANLWEFFKLQHGPHRQGLGFVITGWIMDASRWDARVDSLWIAALLSLSSLLALRLKWKLSGILELKDAWIPIVGLSLSQFESLLITPNSSHSAFPLACILATANLWLADRRAVRYLTGGLGAVILAFTGFGIFAGAVLTFLLAAAAVRHAIAREWSDASLAICGLLVASAGWVAFASDYVFAPAVDGFRFPWTPLTDYLRFILLMLPYPAGADSATLAHSVAGGILAFLILCTTTLLVWAWLKTKEPSPRFDVVLLLAGAGALFVCNVAVGRISLGVNAGMASRYVTLMFPLWLALYLHGVVLPHRWLHRLITLVLWMFALWPYQHLTSRPLNAWPGSLGASNGHYAHFEFFTTGKAAWTDIYLQTGSWEKAQAARGDFIYPNPAATGMDEKLRFFRERQLSFFAPSKGSENFLPWLLTYRAVWNNEFPSANVRQPLRERTTLALIADAPGFAEIPVAATDDTRGADHLEFDIETEHGTRRIVVSQLPATLTVPLRTGFNDFAFELVRSSDATDGSPSLLIGPAHATATPSPNSIILK